MIKPIFPKLFKSALLGVCITALSANMVLASTEIETRGEIPAIISIEPMLFDGAEPAMQPAVIPQDVLDAQSRIDKILFEERMAEIREKGFMVTYTSPMQDYVEIGINPYSQEFADYLQGLLGQEKIKVVAAEKPVLLGPEPYNTGIAPDTPVSAFDTPISSSDTPQMANDAPLTITADRGSAEDANAELLKATAQEKGASESSSFSAIIYGVCALAVAAMVIAVLRKFRKA